MVKYLSRIILRLSGWTVKQSVEPDERCVLIGAPHTTNWDFPLTLLALSSMGVKFNWVAKHSLFFWPLGTLFQYIGGVPVDRSSGSKFLKTTIEQFKTRKSLILAIAPEGTRSKASHWKTGFYIIASKAAVPVILGFIDYQKKEVGIGGRLELTGDMEKDFEQIRDFYRDKVGKIPENQGEIRVKSRN